MPAGVEMSQVEGRGEKLTYNLSDSRASAHDIVFLIKKLFKLEVFVKGGYECSRRRWLVCIWMDYPRDF